MKTFFKEYPYAASQSLTGTFCRAIQRDVSIPSDTAKAIETGDIESLCHGSVAYSYGDSVSDVIGLRQILAFFGKNQSIPLGLSKRQSAYSKFIASEESCARVNAQIRKCERTGHPDRYVESVIFSAQQKIASILGPVPSLESLQFSFGPGANSNVKKNTSARWKLSVIPACSANMTNIISDVLAELPLIASFWGTDHGETWSVPVEVGYGELMFVAKNAKTDRSIIVEPSLNTLVQKGVGSYMKSRLMQHGVNLFDQSEAKASNRQRARIASIRNDLMTVDLSSASDCIAKLLVRELLPFDWYQFLDSIRTSRVVNKEFGLDVELQKFSSMGNGFTFELESLIFYALTWAVCITEKIIPDVSVYGDDIIAPSSVFSQLERVFDAVGFEINSEKSYVSGPFRESCGGDYFLGQDVRPYYQKSNWSLASLYSFHNFLVRKGICFILEELFREVCDAIPSDSKIYGPDGYGDGHLIGDWKPVRTRRSRSCGWGGATFKTRVQVPRTLLGALLPGDYLLPFYSAMVGSGGSNHLAVRGETGRCREVRVYTLSWQ